MRTSPLAYRSWYLVCGKCWTKHKWFLVIPLTAKTEWLDGKCVQRLRDGVIRDIERQNQKKENIRLLGEQIILTKQLEAEREKMLERGSQNT
ncbi:hypothetical protein I79_001870 [Cricetulus griseus]|uniref:Uncharacterized protein n=1 Tax=Cricetulus griseus TaxID=10029 RepID=G3GVW6_CRIGR|nr:hypothetical protein I79_001870 [Cricetulus griseus]